MPCVLPVLAIKLAALAELAERSRREQLRHALAYAAGIALSMLALAAVVVGLRAAGTSVGWGFQLQEPVFLVAICALLVAFAQNLFGAFEIAVEHVAARRDRQRRARRRAQLLRRAARGRARHAVLGAVPRHRGRLRVREPGAA